MNTRLSQLLVMLCLLFGGHAQNLTLHQGCGNDTLVCHVFKSAMSFQGVSDQPSFHHDESYECIQGDMSYDLPLPQAFLDSHPELDEGFTHISIPGGCIDGTTVTYPSNATIAVLPQPQRRRLRTEGNRTFLIVRVTERGRSYSPRDFQIRESVFDDRAGSLFNQMDSCSQGKLKFQKAEGPGIVNGIYEVRLEFDIDGMWNRDVERKHVINKLSPIGGESAYDYVMYCFPPGTKDRHGNTNWGGYALKNHPRSVYNGHWCESLSVLMHEVGHNFGLDHSNLNGWAYADRTGNMGGSTTQTFYPRACYNAAKHWQLGWYDDKSIDLSRSIRSNPWGGRMVAFVDASHTVDSDAVVVRVGTLYAQFNRRKDFNDGSRAFGDRVVIVSAPNTRSRPSNLEAGIGMLYGAPTMFAFPDFEGTGHDLIFEVCDQVNGPPDYVHLSIHLDDGTQSSMCNVPLPTESPTTSPTTSLMPSISPTMSPSASPTISLEPSSNPTEPPTNAPSSSPTDRSTPSPSATPSASPTMDCIGMDLPGLVAVGGGEGHQSCSWIAQREGWKQYLCRPGFDTFEHCQETCDSCNEQVVETMPLGDTCEDSPKMFYVNQRLGSRRCWQLGLFLERWPQWKDETCAPDEPSYDYCPELCGKCTDMCEDQADKMFYVNRRQGRQDCAWLSRRPMWQARLCQKGHDAYKYCNELCNTCE